MTDQETIACAAILHKGQALALPRPARHHTIIRWLSGLVPEREWPVCGGGREQGFLTSAGRYVDRKEAFAVAVSAGQCRADAPRSDELFSEDLW